MKRFAVKLVLFFLFGAIANLTIAAIAANRCADLYSTEPHNMLAAEAFGVWESHFGSDPGLRRSTAGWTHSMWGMVEIKILEPHAVDESPFNRPPVMSITQAGWPKLSFEGWTRPGLSQNQQHCMITIPTEVKRRLSFARISPGKIPYQPIFPGFAINTIVYAAILWLPFAAAKLVRRRHRIKRGLCPACAYPVGTNELCTECGRPTHQNRARE